MILFEGEVTIASPPLPTFLSPPVVEEFVVVVSGPPGPEGPEGPPGPVSDLTLENLTTHINAEMPHPTYDDGTSFLLLYENKKV